MRLLQRRVLLGLCAGACALVFPGVAAATIDPHLALTPNGPAGATGQTLTYDLTFTPGSSTPNDSPATITNHFPAGLLADSTLLDAQNGNAPCLTNSATGPHAMDASCQITAAGSTATLGPPVSMAVPAKEFLVAPPNAADVAGVLLAVFNGTTFAPAGPPADVTVRPNDAGLDVTFSNIPGPSNGPAPQLKALHLLLSDERLPSSCAAENMTVNTVSENGASEETSAPFQSTGCPSQAYAPQVSSQVTAFGGPGPADVSATITQTAGEAASKTIVLDLPSGLQPNLTADAGCLLGAPCQVGTASALTPLAPPAALAHGTVTLGLVGGAPAITVQFPAPYALSFTGIIDTAHNTVTVNNVPDVPITSLSLNITGSAAGAAFITGCTPSNIGANFTGQGGQTSNVSVPITYVNCAAAATPQPPTGTGSVSGLASGHPVLHFSLAHGNNAPNIAKIGITVAEGLKFKSKGLVKHCTKHGHHRKCSLKAKGLTISGAAIKLVKLQGGRLVITLKHAAGQVNLTIRGPLLSESKNLQKKVKKHKLNKLPVTLKLTDASGKITTVVLHLKA